MVLTRSQARLQAANRDRKGFTKLPTEILQQIFSHFCLHCREKHHSGPAPPDAYFRGTSQHPDEPSWYSLERHTLFSMCLVSKDFYYAAQPILYHEFMPGYGDSWRSNLYTWDGRLASFMRTVARRRDLAALVKRTYIHPYLVDVYFMPPIESGKRIIKEARDVLRLVALALRIAVPEQLSAGDLVTLLIAELPNLQHCSLQVEPGSHEIVRSAGLRAAGISCLPLKTVDICPHAQASHLNLFHLEPRARDLFEVSPYLETLNLHMCGGIWDWNRVPLPSLPNLTTVRLTHSRLGEKDLEALLSSCSRLHTFVYESGRRRKEDYINLYWSDPSACNDHFEPSNAVKYLEYHRTTLKSIHLDLRWRGNLIPHVHMRGVFTFREFTHLEHLLLTLDEFHSLFWAGDPAEDSQILVQLLPTSIVSLHLAGRIRNERPRLEKALLSLAEAVAKGEFPMLEEVRCDENEKLSCEDAVITLFRTAGVSFCYDSWPTTQSTLGDGVVWPPPNHPNLMPWEEPYDFDL